MIRIDRISKRFGDFQALHDVSLEIPEGSLTALLGPSGSGKSTLLRIVAGLESPDDGTVEIDGADATFVPPQKRGIGFVFQHYAAFKHMTVYDNVAFGLKIRKAPKARIAARVDELLGIVGLTGYSKRYPSQLSGGQRQRMALARALAVEPRVLLLDEPFGALDATVRQELRQWLRRLHDDVGVTTVLVTHDQEEAMDVSDQLVVLNAGRIEQVGTPREIYEQPATAFAMGFLGPTADLAGDVVRPHEISLSREPAGGEAREHEAMVRRIHYLGFEVRVELELAGHPPEAGQGGSVFVQITRRELAELELADGDVVWARSERLDAPAAGSAPTSPAA